MDFNGEDKKISLSMKALEASAPADEETVYSDSEETSEEE